MSSKGLVQTFLSVTGDKPCRAFVLAGFFIHPPKSCYKQRCLADSSGLRGVLPTAYGKKLAPLLVHLFTVELIRMLESKSPVSAWFCIYTTCTLAYEPMRAIDQIVTARPTQNKNKGWAEPDRPLSVINKRVPVALVSRQTMPHFRYGRNATKA